MQSGTHDEIIVLRSVSQSFQRYNYMSELMGLAGVHNFYLQLYFSLGVCQIRPYGYFTKVI